MPFVSVITTHTNDKILWRILISIRNRSNLIVKNLIYDWTFCHTLRQNERRLFDYSWPLSMNKLFKYRKWNLSTRCPKSCNLPHERSIERIRKLKLWKQTIWHCFTCRTINVMIFFESSTLCKSSLNSALYRRTYTLQCQLLFLKRCFLLDVFWTCSWIMIKRFLATARCIPQMKMNHTWFLLFCYFVKINVLVLNWTNVCHVCTLCHSLSLLSLSLRLSFLFTCLFYFLSDSQR